MSLPRNLKKVALFAIDGLALVFALWSAFALGYGSLWPALLDKSVLLFLLTPIAGVALFAGLGLYRAVLRHLRSLAIQAVLIGVFLLTFSVILLGHTPWVEPVPISVAIIFSLCSTLYVGGTRLIFRSYYRWALDKLFDRERVLIYGAGGAGVQLAKLLESSAEYIPVGFVDDDPSLKKSEVFGLRVYSPDHLESVIGEIGVTSILIALPSVKASVRGEIAQRMARYKLSVKTIPSMPEILSGASIDRLREVQLEDLLGRNAVEPIASLFDAGLESKCVCITGAGGSIGSEIARQAVLGYARTVLLVEQSELGLYKIEQELEQLCAKESLQSVHLVPVLLSVLQQSELQTLLKQYRVHTLYHAAAYKHVPIVESNPFEGLRNNTFGTLAAAEAAIAAGVKRFVLVSTDKAVRPTNVMGASKRLAELILQARAEMENQQTIFSMVRFGNVLGSSGSVVPLFTRQIHSGGPVTVTHPEINRYFMTINEAASLVIQAGAMAVGGEVFVLDMGEPVKIVDLAERMIRLSGFDVKSAENPDGDIEIRFTGLRPGEKLFEELLIGGDIRGTGHPKILCAEEQFFDETTLKELLERVNTAVKSQDYKLLTDTLKQAIDGYKPYPKQLPKLDVDGSDSKIVSLR